MRNEIELKQLAELDGKINDSKLEVRKEVRQVESRAAQLERAMTEFKMEVEGKLDLEVRRALAEEQGRAGEERIKLRKELLGLCDEKVDGLENRERSRAKESEGVLQLLKSRIGRVEDSVAEQIAESNRQANERVELLRVEMENARVREATTIASEKEGKEGG